jgi:hypothetical protein
MGFFDPESIDDRFSNDATNAVGIPNALRVTVQPASFSKYEHNQS